MDRALEQFHAYMKDDNVERDQQEIVDNQQYYELGHLISVKKNGLSAEEFLAQLIHVFEIRRPLPPVEDLSVLKLSQIEYQLLFEMGEAYSLMGDTDSAEAIYKALLANRIDSRCSFVKEKYMEMSFIMAKLSIVKKDYETANKCLTYVFNEFLTASDTRLLYNSFFLQEEICGMAGDVIGTQVLRNFIQATQELMNHMLGKYRLDQ